MLNKIVYDDEITVWWNKYELGKPYPKRYEVFLSGEKVGETDKTHFTFSSLAPETEYEIRITYGGVEFREKIRTARTRRNLDISAPPYCAVGDGKTDDTAAIQRAMDDCDKDSRVYFPRGTFLSGALKLHGGVELYLADGAVLLGSEREQDYLPKIKSRFEGTEMECYASLLNAGELDSAGGANCSDIVIRGKGTICGGGQALRTSIMDAERERLEDFIKSLGDKIKEYENENTIPGRARGRLINFSNVKNGYISGLKLMNGPAWNLHFIYSENIAVFNCDIRSDGISNGDGIDPDSTENCAVFGCEFFTGDDCVAIKSGRNPDGNIIARPCRDIFVFDCMAHGGHGMALGSEMSGGLERIYIYDCDLRDSLWGIHIKGTKKRGGYIRNVRVSDCTVPLIAVRSVTYNDDAPGAETPPRFYDFYFENVTVTGKTFTTLDGKLCKNILLLGFDDGDYRLKDVTFENVTLLGKELDGEPVISERTENIKFINLKQL